MEEKIYIIIDESGGKGYADKQESYKNEVGLICGYVIYNNHLSSILNKTSKIYNKYKSCTEKLHSVELDEKSKNKAVNKYNKIFKKYNINCFFEAIYVEGFYQYNKIQAEKERKSNLRIRKNGILIDNNIEKKFLYSELFTSLILKIFLYHYCKYNTSELSFEIIIDNLDQAVLKKLECNLKSTIDVFTHRADPQELCSYKSDIKKKTKDGSYIIHTGIKYPGNLILANIKYNIYSKINELTFGADIIAYQLRRHLEKKSKTKPLLNLNTSSALEDFKLFNLFKNMTLSEKNIGDTMYRHPSI